MNLSTPGTPNYNVVYLENYDPSCSDIIVKEIDFYFYPNVGWLDFEVAKIGVFGIPCDE